MPKRKPKTQDRVAKLVARADARAQEAGIEPEEYSLAWYRANWPMRKKVFIEREIKIRNMFEDNQEGPFILNDAQHELHLGSLAATFGLIESALRRNPKRYFTALAKPACLGLIEKKLKKKGQLDEEDIEEAMRLLVESVSDQTTRDGRRVQLEDIDPRRTDVTGKCRRVGGTTYYLGDYLSDAIIESNHSVRFVAHDPDSVAEFLENTKNMYASLRPEIRATPKYDNKGQLRLADEQKQIFSKFTTSIPVPGKEGKGRGLGITRLHLTEIPFWQGDRNKAYVALKDAAKGGKITEESTAGGVGDEFHTDYTKGKRKEGGFRSHFFFWWWNRNFRLLGWRFQEDAGEVFLLKSRQDISQLNDEDRLRARVSTYSDEERLKTDRLMQSEKSCAKAILAHLKRMRYVAEDADWLCDDVAAFIAWRRNEIEDKGERNFRTEYPENDVDPFTQAGGHVFDHRYLTVTALMRPASKGHEHKLYLDPSIGIEGGDPYYICVIDCETGEQVHGEGGIKKQDFQGQRCCELSNEYNDAEIGIEGNMGEAAVQEVEDRGYGHRLYKHIDLQTQRDIDDGLISYQDAWLKARPGLFLTERIKRLHINRFEMAWRKGEFRCADQLMCDEAQTYVQNGEQLGAQSGKHDDSIAAGSGCWYLVEHSRIGKPDFVSTGQKLGSALAYGY